MENLESQKAVETILKKTEFLSHFSFDIRPYLRVTTYKRGEYIIRNTDLLTRVLYLEHGTAKLYGFHENGRQTLISFFTPPSFFGVPELFEESKRPFPIVAQTDCRFIEVDTSGCRYTLLADALFLRFCCSMALKQNVAQNRRYINLTAYPAKNNLAFCLLKFQSDGLFSLKFTELAEYLTISYRHLMQLVSEMCGDGLIERTSKGLRILDRKKLQALAGGIHEDWYH